MNFSKTITLLFLIGALACSSSSDESAGTDSGPIAPPSVDCAQIRLVEARSGTHATSSVGAFVVVDDCDGEPLLGLVSEQFQVLEDGEKLEFGGSGLKLLQRTPELFVSIVLERTEETLASGVAEELIAGAKKLVDDLVANSGPKGLRVSVSFVADHWILAQKYTTDWDAVAEAIEGFSSLPESTSVNSKSDLFAHRPMEGLSHALGYSLQTHGPPCGAMKGSVWMLGQTVVVTSAKKDGDEAAFTAVEALVDKAGEDMVVLKIGDGDWHEDWKALGRNGLYEATSPGAIDSAMVDVSERLLALRARGYSLAYCSQKDSGFHELGFAMKGTESHSNVLLFDASLLMIDDLDLQCSNDLFLTECSDPFCSGLRCDGCAPEGLDYCIASGNCWEVLCTYGTPGFMDLDDSHVYWSDASRGELVRIEKATGEYSYEAQVLVDGLENPLGLALDNEWLYWVDEGTGLVQRRHLENGEIETLADTMDGLNRVQVESEQLYWTSSDGVWTLDLEEGSPTKLSGTTGASWSIALWQGDVFWTEPGAGVVKGWSPGLAEPKVLAESLTEVDAIAVDASHVYFTTKNDLMRVAKSGGEPVLLAQSPAFSPSIDMDSSHVYWVYDEEVFRVLKSGGDKEQVAKEKPVGPGIAVDETHVYWAGLAQILKLVHD